MCKCIFSLVLVLLCSCQRRGADNQTVAKETIPYRANPKCIAIDAGHGGKDPGTMTRKGPKLYEKNVALDVALRVQKILERRGLTVIMTRNNDTFIPLHRRVEIAQNNHSSIFVSIHFNWASNPKAQGVEIYYYNSKKTPLRSQKSQVLGKLLLGKITSRCKAKSRGVLDGDFHVIRETKMPSVLIEGGFFSNPIEARQLANKNYIQSLAESIAQGIEAFMQGQKAKITK